METLLGGLAFGCLIAAQFFAVVAVHNERWESDVLLGARNSAVSVLSLGAGRQSIPVREPCRYRQGYGSGANMVEEQDSHITDVLADPEYTRGRRDRRLDAVTR